VRLTRRGLEVKLENGVRLLHWQRMQSHIRARRS
jgi:predicted nucleic acid-binding Zn ribbon protein